MTNYNGERLDFKACNTTILKLLNGSHIPSWCSGFSEQVDRWLVEKLSGHSVNLLLDVLMCKHMLPTCHGVACYPAIALPVHHQFCYASELLPSSLCWTESAAEGWSVAVVQRSM